MMYHMRNTSTSGNKEVLCGDLSREVAFHKHDSSTGPRLSIKLLWLEQKLFQISVKCTCDNYWISGTTDSLSWLANRTFLKLNGSYIDE